MHLKLTSRRSGPKRSCRGFAVLEIALALAAAAALVLVEDKAPVRPSREARNHIDEMVVRLSKNAEPRKVYYLDSEEDYRDEKNLALVIAYENAEKFKKAGIDDPS